MKKSIYLLMIFGLFILGGCNLFSGMDKEDLDGSSFDYKLEESMASGDYSEVTKLVTEKIASTPELKAIDDVLKGYEPDDWTTATDTELNAYYNQLKTYYSNTSGSSVDYYVELKLNEAGAYLGLAGLKMTDIVAQITNATKSTTKSTNNPIELGELVPSGLNMEYLTEAIHAYVMGLPANEFKEKFELYYLNGALSSAINAVNGAIQIFAVDPDSNEIVFKKWSNLTSEDKNDWSNLVSTTKIELTVAQELLNLYINSSAETIDSDDANEINSKITTLIGTIKEFTVESDYTAFTSAASIAVEP